MKNVSIDTEVDDSQGPMGKKYIFCLPLCAGVYRLGRSNLFRHPIGTRTETGFNIIC